MINANDNYFNFISVNCTAEHVRRLILLMQIKRSSNHKTAAGYGLKQHQPEYQRLAFQPAYQTSDDYSTYVQAGGFPKRRGVLLLQRV